MNIYQIKKIWLSCFDDSEDYYDSFFSRFYSPDYMITHEVNNEIVSVSYIFPCTSALGNTAYLFGLATLPDHRGKGYASALIIETLEMCKKRNFDVVIQIPAKKSMKSFFKKFGFVDTNINISFTTDFILGTGNPNEDVAMIIFLKDQNMIFSSKELICKPL